MTFCDESHCSYVASFYHVLCITVILFYISSASLMYKSVLFLTATHICTALTVPLYLLSIHLRILNALCICCAKPSVAR